jgi:hypothetical protein
VPAERFDFFRGYYDLSTLRHQSRKVRAPSTASAASSCVAEAQG